MIARHFSWNISFPLNTGKREMQFCFTVVTRVKLNYLPIIPYFVLSKFSQFYHFNLTGFHLGIRRGIVCNGRVCRTSILWFFITIWKFFIQCWFICWDGFCRIDEFMFRILNISAIWVRNRLWPIMPIYWCIWNRQLMELIILQLLVSADLMEECWQRGSDRNIQIL